jgi:solute carrier family 25 oxoglutarate transporter 11
MIILQLTGVGGAVKEHRSSMHAIMSILRNEGLLGVYNG